ncbi:MAG: hypothetical protein RLZZ546_914 [Bacteroidota bacterium]|jgi:hypothetical protein
MYKKIDLADLDDLDFENLSDPKVTEIIRDMSPEERDLFYEDMAKKEAQERELVYNKPQHDS